MGGDNFDFDCLRIKAKALQVVAVENKIICIIGIRKKDFNYASCCQSNTVHITRGLKIK